MFHHHQLQFQVIEENGKDVPFTGWQDTVNLPFRAADKDHPDRCKCNADGSECRECTCPTKDDPQGSVVVLIPFLNPVIEGKSVYHCHIGEHEDNGMMQVISMTKNAGRCEAGTPSNIDRLKMTPKARAVCKPGSKHDHTQLMDQLKKIHAAGATAAAGTRSSWNKNTTLERDLTGETGVITGMGLTWLYTGAFT